VKEAISEADDANEAVAPKETTKARPEQDRSGSEELLGSLLEALSKSKKANVGAAVEQWVAALGESRTQSELLGVVENLPQNVAKYASWVLKGLYDEGMLSEDDIFAWHSAAEEANQAVVAAAKFVEFLKQA